MPRSRARPPPTPSATRTGPGRRGRWAQSRRSSRTRGIPGGRCGTGSAPTPTWSTRPTPGWATGRWRGGTCPPGGSSPPAPPTRRWSARRITSPPRTSVPRAARPGGRPPVLLAGLVRCGRCGRRLESAWSNGKPAYRCRHGYTSATRPGPGRPKNVYVREDHILPRLAALAILRAAAGKPAFGKNGRRARMTAPAQAAELIDQLRATASASSTTQLPKPCARMPTNPPPSASANAPASQATRKGGQRKLAQHPPTAKAGPG